MLYKLSPSDVKRLRAAPFNPEFTGAEMLFAAYRTDPAVVSQILPTPLRPAPEPLAVCFVARYPQTNFGCVYNEGALFVQAVFKGEPGLYCLSMPVDDDTAMVTGREIFGYPKKMADAITLDRSGDTVVGRVVRKGTEILRIGADLDRGPGAEDLTTLRVLHVHDKDSAGRSFRTSVSFLFKFFQSPDRKRFDYLPRLVRQPNLIRPRGDVRRGEARVVVTSSPYDPLGEVPVIGSPIECIYGTFDNTMLPGGVVARAWNVPRFLPHAFFKTDVPPVLLGWTQARASATTGVPSSV